MVWASTVALFTDHGSISYLPPRWFSICDLYITLFIWATIFINNNKNVDNWGSAAKLRTTYFHTFSYYYPSMGVYGSERHGEKLWNLAHWFKTVPWPKFVVTSSWALRPPTKFKVGHAFMFLTFDTFIQYSQARYHWIPWAKPSSTHPMLSFCAMTVFRPSWFMSKTFKMYLPSQMLSNLL